MSRRPLFATLVWVVVAITVGTGCAVLAALSARPTANAQVPGLTPWAYLPAIMRSSSPVSWGNWQQGTGTNGTRFNCLAVADSGDVYAGGTHGVYRSTDHGQTWLARGLPDKSVCALLAVTSTLYAGVTHGGVYYSADGGAIWTPRNTGLSSLEVTGLAARPGQPTTLYAGLYAAPGVARTTNSGTNWQDWGQGLPGEPLILSLVVDPTNPDTLYAGEASGVYKSTSGGANWAWANSPLDWIDSLSLKPDNSHWVYAGQRGGWVGWPTGYRSPDGGGTWVTLPRGGIWAWGPDGLYCGTTEGVWRSPAAEAAAWEDFSQGLGDKDVSALLFSSAANTFYAATASGVWRRTAP